MKIKDLEDEQAWIQSAILNQRSLPESRQQTARDIVDLVDYARYPGHEAGIIPLFRN